MMAKAKKLQIKLVKSVIGSKPKQRATVKALGLGKIDSVVEQEANPVILGMIAKVSHLVAVEEIK